MMIVPTFGRIEQKRLRRLRAFGINEQKEKIFKL